MNAVPLAAGARAHRPGAYRALLWGSTGLMVIGSLVGIAVPAGAGWDFANFYDAGRRVAVGEMSQLYEPLGLIGGIESQGVMRFWGTPISALFYVPLSWFQPGTALVLFKIENVLAFAATFAVLFVFCQPFIPATAHDRLRFAAIFALLCLIFQPFWTVFRVGGQTTPTVVLLMTLALVCHVQGRDWPTAFLVVLAALIKPAVAPALICLALLSGRSFAVRMSAVLLAVGLVSVALLGWPIHLAFLDRVRNGVENTFPWYYNSSLFILVDNLRAALGPAAETGIVPRLFPALDFVLKLVVMGTVVFLVFRSRGLAWTMAARRHFVMVLSILFFLWWSVTLWEHYVALLFIPLVYFVAASRHFSRPALILVAAIFVLSMAQNLIVTDWLRRHVVSDGGIAILAVGLVKAGPLLLMLVFAWRHHREWFESYETPAWNHVQPAASRSAGA